MGREQGEREGRGGYTRGYGSEMEKGNGGILYDISCTLVNHPFFWHGVWALLGGKEVKRWVLRGGKRGHSMDGLNGPVWTGLDG